MKQTPLPMVSGRYFFPNAPLLCLKWMPAWAVTSMNSIGPEGLAFMAFAFVVVPSVDCVAAESAGSAWGGGFAVDEIALASSADLRPQPMATTETSSKRAKLRCTVNSNNPPAQGCRFMWPHGPELFAVN